MSFKSAVLGFLRALTLLLHWLLQDSLTRGGWGGGAKDPHKFLRFYLCYTLETYTDSKTSFFEATNTFLWYSRA